MLAVVDDLLAEQCILYVELEDIKVKRVHPVAHLIARDFDIKAIPVIRDRT